MGNRQRALLATAFDSHPNGWIWYANAWSRGVVVSEAEREIYLKSKPLDFRHAIVGRRATEPRRSYLPTFWRLLKAIICGHASQAR